MDCLTQKSFRLSAFPISDSISPFSVSSTGMPCCLESYRRNLEAVLYHDLLLVEWRLRSSDNFSKYDRFRSLCSVVTSLRFFLNLFQACTELDRFAFLNNRLRYLITALMFVFIHSGSFGLIVTVIFGIDSFAATIICLVIFSEITFTSPDVNVSSQLIRCNLCRKMDGWMS